MFQHLNRYENECLLFFIIINNIKNKNKNS